jgi:hypothetical protein
MRTSCEQVQFIVGRALTIVVLVVAVCNQVMAQGTRKIVPPPPVTQSPNPIARPIPGSSSTPASAPQPAQWRPLPGGASAIAANARGEVWIISNTPRTGQHIYRLQGTAWREVAGSGVRIAVDPVGNAWIVEADGAILRHTGVAWERIPGDAMDIAVGANGAVWIIGRDQSISHAIVSQAQAVKPAPQLRTRGPQTRVPAAPTLQYRWEKVSGAAVRIAVDAEGNPWVVNSAGQVYHYHGGSWTQFPVAARNIAVGADGVVYLVGTIPSASEFPIMRSQGTNWVNDGVAGTEIAAGPAGVAYAIKGTGNGTIAERVPNRATAGAPPLLPVPTSVQPVQQASGNSPATQPPANAPGVRPIGGAHTPATVSTQQPIQVTSATIQISQPPAATPGSISISAPSQAIPISPPNITPPPGTPVPGQPATSQGSVVVPSSIATPTIQQPTNMVAAPAGTINLQSSTITVNQATGGIPVSGLKPPGAPTGSTGSPSITTGSLVIPGSSAANPVAPSSTAAPLQVTGLGYVPISAPSGSHLLIPGDPYVYSSGKLLCSDPEVMGKCGNVDAGYVGPYTLNMTCSSGFYDMTNGGTCWKCPSSDDHGTWLRSATSVTSNDACWRNATSSAHWDKYGLAWDCSSGEFWDSQDQNKNVHGSCWDCPSDYSTRSADAVQSSTACYSKQISQAFLIKYNGCSQPNKTTMYPNDLRRPGEPFLDIASGLSVASNAGGACWACPVTDEQGDYLYTERNANTLIGRKTGNNGCMVQFKYKSGVFVEPGLSGLPGVADVLAQEQLFQRPAALTTYLYGLAQAKTFSGAAADTWVAAQWSDIAAHPYQNAQIKALMYEYVTGGAPSYMYASGAPGSGSAAEQAAQLKLVNSFQEYIRARRTYIAQEALDMYYQWKQNVGVQRSLHAESQLQTLFYYGTVPLDFQSIVAAAMVPTVTGTAVMASIVGAENYGSIAQAQANSFLSKQTNAGQNVVSRQFRVSNLLRDMFKPSQGAVAEPTEAPNPEVNISPEFAFEPSDIGAEGGALAGETAGETSVEGAAEGAATLMAQLDLVSGPVGIALAGATMAAIAIQQVVQIATAESNLVNAKNTAMNAVNLNTLLQQLTGPDQAAQYWSEATGVKIEQGDTGINAQAAQAYTAAQQSRFAQLQAATPAAGNSQQSASSSALGTAPQQSVSQMPAPGELVVCVNATNTLTADLAGVITAGNAAALQPKIAVDVQQLNNARQAFAMMPPTSRLAANQHMSDLTGANAALSQQVTRIQSIPTLYGPLQGTLSQLQSMGAAKLALTN